MIYRLVRSSFPFWATALRIMDLGHRLSPKTQAPSAVVQVLVVTAKLYQPEPNFAAGVHLK
jgi:hypothetical protein